jgi:hypothetical protein
MPLDMPFSWDVIELRCPNCDIGLFVATLVGHYPARGSCDNCSQRYTRVSSTGIVWAPMPQRPVINWTELLEGGSAPRRRPVDQRPPPHKDEPDQ